MGSVPPFFIIGTGPTVLRQIILSNAIAILAIASLVLFRLFTLKREDFFFWYPVSLAVIAIGLIAALLTPAMGSPVNWVGRGYAIYRRRFRACRYYCRRQAHTTEASRLKKHSAGSSARLKWGTGCSWKLPSMRLWSLTRITGSLSGTRLLRRCSGTQRTKRPDYPSPNSSGTATMEFRPMETRFAFHQRGVIVKRNRYSVLSEEREHVSCRIGAVPADGFRLNAQYVHHP